MACDRVKPTYIENVPYQHHVRIKTPRHHKAFLIFFYHRLPNKQLSSTLIYCLVHSPNSSSSLTFSFRVFSVLAKVSQNETWSLITATLQFTLHNLFQLHCLYVPCRSLGSFSISFQLPLSLHIFLQPLTSLFFRSFSISSNHLLLGFPTESFPSGISLNTFLHIFCTVTNQCTINWQCIILILHVSTLLWHLHQAHISYLLSYIRGLEL